MLVELDAFSGRPNPRWELDDESAATLRRLMSRLSVATETPPEPPGLGYRGFVFACDAGRTRAYKGYVIRPDIVLADPSSSVERFLLDHLPRELQNLGPRVALAVDGVE